MASSGSYKRHDGFNPIQIKNGLVVRLNKNGIIRSVLGKYGEYGKEKGLKSHVVVAKSGSEVKTIRFGQQGVSGSPKKAGETKSYRQRRQSFKARHAKNIAKGPMSAAYWADKAKW